MGTVTKIILGVLSGVFAICATLIFILTENIAATVLLTGLATSALGGLAGISYGNRLANAYPVEPEVTPAPATPTDQ